MNEDLHNTRKEKIFSFITNEQYIPLKKNELAYVLDVPKTEMPLFENVIEDLIASCKIIETKKGKLMAAHKLNMFTGTFIGNTKGDFGFFQFDSESGDDVFIPASQKGGALHGDEVLIRVISPKEKGRRAEGEVIRIINRGIQEIVGTYEQTKYFGFLVPDNKKFSTDIFIPEGKNCGAVTGHKVVAKITKRDSRRNPEGEILEILGHRNDVGVDVLSVVKQYNVPLAFSDECMSMDIPQSVSSEDRKGRRDLRDVLTVTIDNDDSKDLDDAISLSFDGHHYLLSVHIADVSYYVKENSALDKEAAQRGTSIYLLDRVIPMLPFALSNGICSLNENEDRLALSCLMTIDAKGKVISHEIVKSVIHSNKKMTYGNVNKILENDQDLLTKYKDLVEMFRIMQTLADILRKNRKQRGSLDFDFPETKIKVDENGKPVSILPYERNVASGIIEEFMLVCNETVAEEYFYKDYPFIFRCHENPDTEKIMKLLDFIYNFGYFIKGSSGHIHPKALQKVLIDTEQSPEEHLIKKAVLRSLKQARYTSINGGHFGLAAKYYCHFTSPIRRYPDLQIHRIISHSIDNAIDDKQFKEWYKKMPEIAKQSSLQERKAEEMEREVIKMKMAEFMENKIGEVYEGIIAGLTSFGMFVALVNTIEGYVSFSSLTDDYYSYDEKNMLVIGKRTSNTFRIGNKVHVKVARASKEDRTIDFEIFEG